MRSNIAILLLVACANSALSLTINPIPSRLKVAVFAQNTYAPMVYTTDQGSHEGT